MEKDAVIDAVRDFAESEGYRYEFNAEREFLRLGFKVDCKLKHVDIILALVDLKQIDLAELEKYGKVRILKPDEIFPND